VAVLDGSVAQLLVDGVNISCNVLGIVGDLRTLMKSLKVSNEIDVGILVGDDNSPNELLGDV
jgi:hypothetical protein